uniref:Uncharacterized protein n=1 Tax=Meloidogyne incognita TaxID=6306 RepID=A0A914MAW2_MELIC
MCKHFNKLTKVNTRVSLRVINSMISKKSIDNSITQRIYCKLGDSKEIFTVQITTACEKFFEVILTKTLKKPCLSNERKRLYKRTIWLRETKK